MYVIFIIIIVPRIRSFSDDAVVIRFRRLRRSLFRQRSVRRSVITRPSRRFARPLKAEFFSSNS